MSRPNVLDQKIMSKIAKKIGKKDIRSVNVMVSRKASKLGVSAEAGVNCTSTAAIAVFNLATL